MGRQIRATGSTLFNKYSEWPGLYSMTLTVLISWLLSYYETGIGAKIDQLSWQQTYVCLLVIFIVSKNVFVPSRATRFMENPVAKSSTDAQSAAASQQHKLDKAKLKMLPKMKAQLAQNMTEDHEKKKNE